MAHKIILHLDQPEYTALLGESVRELRTPSDHARWLLRQSLGIADHPGVPSREIHNRASEVLADSGAVVA